MRVHDPVDESRGPGVGRQGVEEVGEVVGLRHGQGRSSDSISSPRGYSP